MLGIRGRGYLPFGSQLALEDNVCLPVRTSSSPLEPLPFIYYYKHPPSNLLYLFFQQPPPHALQTFCHPSSPLQRRRPDSLLALLPPILTIPQVRAVVAPSDDLILSASRDSTAISWIRGSESSFSPAHTFRAGSRFINAVAYLKPTPEAPQGKNLTCRPGCGPPSRWRCTQATSLPAVRTR